GDGARPGMPDYASGMEGETSRNDEWLADRNTNSDITGSAIADSASKADTETPAPPSNPRQRLQALGRLLDPRLTQARGAARGSGGGGGEWGGGRGEEGDEDGGMGGGGWTSEAG